MTNKIHFISAGAGSGKTYRLTQLLHEQLTSGAIRPSGVIATTFTKKAATELRERVRSHLLERGNHRLANAMGQARIGTVNGICGGLLERFAFEAGMATEQQVLEERQAGILLKQAIDAVLDAPAVTGLLRIVRRLGRDEKAQWLDELKELVDLARANDIDPASLRRFAAENAADLLSHFPTPTQTDLSSHLLAAISDAMPTLVAQAEAGQKKNTGEYVALLRSIDKAIRCCYASWSDWVRLSKTFPEVGVKPLAEPINELAARFAEHPDLHRDIRDYLEQMFSLCADALSIYAERKRELGVLDFVDQEHLLLKILDDPAVSCVLAEELDLLLVDEFQDTSPIQLALFIKLARFAKSIYWVGDIKQAIYGFRGSDTALMEAILKELPNMGGDKEILDFSWRSRPPLVDLVNQVFRHAFANSLAPEEIELQAQRKDGVDGLPNPSFANWLLGGKNQQQEYTALAAGIRQLVESAHIIFDKKEQRTRPVRYGDIAILSRKGENVAGIAATLRVMGIPSATSQPGLLATPEVTLALACLRRLNDSSDTIATAEILSLADSMEPEEWVVDRLKYLAADGNADRWQEDATEGRTAHPLMVRLAAMRTRLPLLAPAEAMQAVITECDLPGRVLRWTQDASVARARLANLEALLALAAQYEDICRSAQHAASISGLIIWLGELAKDGQDNLAEPAIDAVKVMTHHAAKGLEWPVVVLMDLAANIKSRLWSISAMSRSAVDVQEPLKDRFIRYWPWPFGKQGRVPVADAIALTETAAQFRNTAIEESKRLLYVSMTRARDLLVLARSARKPSGEWLDAVESPWLLSESGDTEVTLPDGQKIVDDARLLDPVESPELPIADARAIHWFETPTGSETRLPLDFNPSGAKAVVAEYVEQVRVGKRIPLANAVDMTALGSAVHACVALAFTDPDAKPSADEINALLDGMGVGDKVSSAAVLGQITALEDWIRTRWGETKAFAEYPVQSILDNGQVLQGRMDLLLRTQSGWVLLDHKSSPAGAEQWPAIANEYRGQMLAYAKAVERASGVAVDEGWIFLPVAGGAVRLW